MVDSNPLPRGSQGVKPPWEIGLSGAWVEFVNNLQLIKETNTQIFNKFAENYIKLWRQFHLSYQKLE